MATGCGHDTAAGSALAPSSLQMASRNPVMDRIEGIMRNVPKVLPRLLRLRGERCGEEAEGQREDDRERRLGHRRGPL
jgi:hypothetical protein